MGSCISNQNANRPHRPVHLQPPAIQIIQQSHNMPHVAPHLRFPVLQVPQSLVTKNPIQNTANYVFIKSFIPHKPLLVVNYQKTIVLPDSNDKLKNQIQRVEEQYIDLKVPKNLSLRTQYHWIKQNRYNIPPKIATFDQNFIKTRSFQEKYQWFRAKLEQKRISWQTEKSEELVVDQKNLIMTSGQQFQKINFYKELKIVFLEEKKSLDAGGLLRQWMSLSINQIFNRELALFTLCDTIDTSYKLNYNQQVKQLFLQAAKILGVVIGKAIFQKIPLKCPLNYTILRQICNQAIHLSDVFSYDKDYYKGWQSTLNGNYASQLQQNFCIYEFDEHGNEIPTYLKPNGETIMVNSLNKQQYIELCIEHYCTKSIHDVLTVLRNSIYRIIPMNLLEIFQPQELDMIICGKDSIDPLDLKINTDYINCKPEDQVIQWLWLFIATLPQNKLSNLLHFVTGTGRVPIKGFKYLESNRGEIKKFTIQKVPFSLKQTIPRSHTCFNRLQLPDYPSYQILVKNVGIIVDNIITAFGLQ